jgi:hypothetical protein
MFFGKMVIVQSWRKANGDVEYNRDEDNTAQSAVASLWSKIVSVYNAATAIR